MAIMWTHNMKYLVLVAVYIIEAYATPTAGMF